MSEAPISTGVTPRQYSYTPPESFPERHYTPRGNEDIQSPYLERFISGQQVSDSPFEPHDVFSDRYDGPANDGGQYLVPNIGNNAEPRLSHDLRNREIPSRFAVWNPESVLRGIENYTEVSSSPSRNFEPENYVNFPTESASSYNVRHHPNLSNQAGNLMSIQPFPYLTRSGPQAAVRTSRYYAFSGKFIDTESASAFRKDATRFNRKPYRPPDSDGSIEDISNDRLRHVERIYNAMTRADAARDNGGSIAMKRWVHGAYYDPSLVEAYAHKVLDCLLAQAKKGFRGWPHNDYVTDDRKGEDEDRDVSCAERLDNIILALEQEKTICEDVMNSACQIRMFVNAPKAYANRKYQNRVGNSKRGRPKDAHSDASGRSSKARKLNMRPRTRAISTTSTSKETPYFNQTPEPPLREQDLQPRYPTPPMGPLQVVSSPIPSSLAPRIAPAIHYTDNINATAQPSSFRPYPLRNSNAMSPALPLQPHAPHIPRVTSMPPPQPSPLVSPPNPSHGHQSAPTTPDDMKLSNIRAASSSFDNLQPVGSLDTVPFPTLQSFNDPMLFPPEGDWSEEFQSSIATGSANLFDHFPDAGITLLDLELQRPTDEQDQGNNLQAYWNN